MKYFTPELHVRMQDFASDATMDAAEAASEAAGQRYDAHLQALAPEMPPWYRQFDDLLLQGAQVWAIGRSGDQFLMVLHKEIPPRDVVVLTYTLTREPFIDREALPPLYRSGVMDFLYDEFDLVREKGEKHGVHSILFGNGWEIRLQFPDVKVTTMEPLYPVPGTVLTPVPTSVAPCR